MVDGNNTAANDTMDNGNMADMDDNGMNDSMNASTPGRIGWTPRKQVSALWISNVVFFLFSYSDFEHLQQFQIFCYYRYYRFGMVRHDLAWSGPGRLLQSNDTNSSDNDSMQAWRCVKLPKIDLLMAVIAVISLYHCKLLLVHAYTFM